MLLATALVVAGCSGGSDGPGYEEDAYPPGYNDTLGETSGGSCLGQNLWARPDFDWRMSRGVTLDIAVVLQDGTPWTGVMVSVYDDASDEPGLQNLLAEGMTGEDGLWTGWAVLPSDQAAVNIVANIVGAKNWDRVPVVDGHVTAEFGRGE